MEFRRGNIARFIRKNVVKRFGDVFRILTPEGHITCEGHISFRSGGTHRSKKKSTSYEVLFV